MHHGKHIIWVINSRDKLQEYVQRVRTWKQLTAVVGAQGMTRQVDEYTTTIVRGDVFQKNRK